MTLNPSNIFSFTRRITRWAGQTAEVFSLPWTLCLTSKIIALLSFVHLYNSQYIFSFLNIYRLGFWLSGMSPVTLIQFINSNMQVLWVWTLVLVELSLIWLFQFLFVPSWISLWSLKNFFNHMFLAMALHSFTGSFKKHLHPQRFVRQKNRFWLMN